MAAACVKVVRQVRFGPKRYKQRGMDKEMGRIRKGRDMGDAGKRSGQSRREKGMNAMGSTTNGGVVSAAATAEKGDERERLRRVNAETAAEKKWPGLDSL